jgi:hypothetical protein
MTVTIDLPAALENDVRRQAARRGQKVDEFIVHAVEAQLAEAQLRDPSNAPPPIATQGKRGYTADQVIAMLQIPQPAPDDAQCQQILEEELLRKYGR